jgi:pyrimidine-nucleoside phosphorylase
MMNPVECIRRKRDGGILSRPEMEEFVGAYTRGEIPEYQMSAFLMAVYFNGMDSGETLAFTDIMLRSGDVIDLSSIPGRKVDKHSTGGVGDKVSLILAPMVAACGVPVPMISGRGLGHTGGTLDKLESIPGFRTGLSVGEFRQAVGGIGIALAGQTAEIAPADRKMYALRDVTGTIECLPLIAGSIMSKKLAEGIDALVLDVKAGPGAFMPTEGRAIELARLLVDIGERYGKQTLAFITAMDQPLGLAIGNWLEVAESITCLRGKNIPDLMEVTTVLGGAMVFLGRKAGSIEEGMQQCRSAIWSGKAYEKFLHVVERQGGDVALVRAPLEYRPAPQVVDVSAGRTGWITGFDTKRIGMLAVELGAGRKRIDDAVDPRTGIVLEKKLGDRVRAGDLVARLHLTQGANADLLAVELLSSITISDAPVQVGPRVLAVVDAAGVRPWRTPQVH